MKKTKKVISSVLLVMLAGMLMFVLSSCGDESSKALSAKEITLHNGVTLGMTVDEVIACEKSNGVTLKKGSKGNEYHYPQKGTYYSPDGPVTIDGQKGMVPLYYFDDNGKLTGCVYYYDGMLGYMIGAANTISKDSSVSALQSKFGSPSASRAADAVDPGKAIDAMDCWNCQIRNNGSSVIGSIKDCYQWIVPTTDGGIEVQFITATYTVQGHIYTNNYTSYSLLTQEEMSRVK